MTQEKPLLVLHSTIPIKPMSFFHMRFREYSRKQAAMLSSSIFCWAAVKTNEDNFHYHSYIFVSLVEWDRWGLLAFYSTAACRIMQMETTNICINKLNVWEEGTNSLSWALLLHLFYFAEPCLLLLRIIPNVKVNKNTIQSGRGTAISNCIRAYPVHKIKSMLSPILDFMKAKTDVSKSPDESQW